jgi:hypothetical protein
MSLQTVRADYDQERLVLEGWRNRMDIFTPVTEVPPESAMSPEYRQGWRHYLEAVLSISNKMLAKCDAAAAASGDVEPLRTLLLDEANAYDTLATQANELPNVDLSELVTMLKHEASSRRDVAEKLLVPD